MITFLKIYFVVTFLLYCLKITLFIKANIPKIKSTINMIKAGMKLKGALKPQTVKILNDPTHEEINALKAENNRAWKTADMWKGKYYQLLNNEPQDK